MSHISRKWQYSLIVALCLGLLVVALGAPTASAAPYPATHLNGFENVADATACPSGADTETMFGVARVTSGTGGITSADGAFHATAPTDATAGCNMFSRLGGYSSTFPAGGYTVSVDIYLDTAVSGTTNDRLDWSSAINKPDGNHRRDFVFSIGGNGTGGWVMSASNNAPGWPGNPGRDPLTITTSGWYTFEHVFRDNAGVLEVDMNVRDAGGTLLKSWTLSDPTDTIGTNVGGNRYAWLVTNDFANLPLDNLYRSGAPCTTICYADAINGNDLNGGTSPADAKKTIQAAVNQVTAGGQVIAAAGVYVENVVIPKSLTLTGAGQTDDALGTVLDGDTLNGIGIFVNNSVTDVTIANLRVKRFNNSSTASGIWANYANNGFTVQNVTVDDNGWSPGQGGGIFVNGVTVGVDDVLIDQVTATNNKTRGIVIWNGFKTNITITNNTVTGNNCCGIELQDGTASGVTVTGNTVSGNADSGMAFTGLTSGAGPNVIAGNTLSNNGRFGMEIKLPNGTGLDTGDGSIVVENNTVSLSTPSADLRDFAGIAVFRRGWLAGNVDIPTGVIVRNNTVSGYQQTNAFSDSTGFGIVVEGTNMTVTGNTLNNNDVGAQTQGGHLPYTANTNIDGDQSNLADQFFGRGNSPVGCAAVSGNTFSGNTYDFRTVGTGGGLVTNTDTGEVFCSIQAAIDDSDTQNGHTIVASAGVYQENVNVHKSVTLKGANAGVSPNDPITPLNPNGARGPETEMAVTGGGIAFNIKVPNVTIDGFKFTDSAVAQADIQKPLIATGLNFGGDGPGFKVVNNLFSETSRVLFYSNGPNQMAGGIVDDNRVQNPGRADTGCGTAPTVAPSNCGYQLFNPWRIDGLSFQGNVTVANPGSGDRIRTLNFFNSTAVTIADNTIRNTCIYNCINIASGTSGNVLMTGNDIVTDVGSVIQIHSSWTTTGATINVHHNYMTTGDDFPIVVDALSADLDNVHINRNAISGTYHARNGTPPSSPGAETLDITCNWWGGIGGPNKPNGLFGPLDSTPWLYTSDLNGPCYVGGTIAIDKVAAGGGATEFEFDLSWSGTNVTLTDADAPYVTTPPLQAGNYAVTEINLPPGWSQQSATCDNTTTTPVETVSPSFITVADGNAWVCTFTNVYTPPPTNVCNVQDSSALWTDIIGAGMGNPKTHKVSVKVNIPNYTQVTSLYGQMVAKDPGKAKYVRFILPGANNYVQVNSVTSPIDHAFGNFWYGDYIDPAKLPAKSVTGQWFLQASGTKGHIPRALVLYPTYNDPNKTYVNIWNTYDAAEAEVYWNTAQGWTQTRVITESIAPPNGPTTFNVELALVDNDKDARPVWVTVEAGGVSVTQKPKNPTNGDQLNLMTFTLKNVPAGTDTITITLYSPSKALDRVEGDSAALVGMRANYVCAPLTQVP